MENIQVLSNKVLYFKHYYFAEAFREQSLLVKASYVALTFPPVSRAVE